MPKNIIKKALFKLSKTNKSNIFFTHIPKTGGTSIDNAISRLYVGRYCRIKEAASQKAADIFYGENEKADFSETIKLRKHILAYEMAKGTQYISGHVYFDLGIWNSFHKKYAYTTLLRDPIKRYLSYYLFNAFKKEEYGRVDQDLSEFITSDHGKSQGSTYIKYLSGVATSKIYPSEIEIEKAKHNLSKFQLIGFLEDLDQFIDRFEKRFKFKPKVSHKNKSPAAEVEINKSVMDEIHRICQPDIEIYNYAKKELSQIY